MGPRMMDPRMMDPRMMDPRMMDPRMGGMDPRMGGGRAPLRGGRGGPSMGGMGGRGGRGGGGFDVRQMHQSWLPYNLPPSPVQGMAPGHGMQLPRELRRPNMWDSTDDEDGF